MPTTTTHPVTLRYTRDELLTLFAFAHEADVERGGRYDARGGVIHVWTHRWDHPATREESELIGSFYANWVEESVWMIECEQGFSLADLLYELAVLEEQALGDVKHGRQRQEDR
jgi:hypothetical protein